MERDGRSEGDRARGSHATLLFVCTGNTCRSPMAEALARGELARRGEHEVRVRSAGVAAEAGQRATPHAIEVIREVGLDLEGHRSTPLTPELVAWADLILAMSPSHLRQVAEFGGAHKAALLADYAAGQHGAGGPIADPWGGDAAEYRSTLEELQLLIPSIIDRITLAPS